eukprot:symbB.v1.2.036986.t1/scaffold5348.1/size28215/4
MPLLRLEGVKYSDLRIFKIVKHDAHPCAVMADGGASDGSGDEAPPLPDEPPPLPEGLPPLPEGLPAVEAEPTQKQTNGGDAKSSVPAAQSVQEFESTPQANQLSGSAVAGGHTPESIARLPPKLRQRLVQRGILKEEDVKLAMNATQQGSTSAAPAPSAPPVVPQVPAALAWAQQAAAARVNEELARMAMAKAAAAMTKADSPFGVASFRVVVAVGSSNAKTTGAAPGATSAGLLSRASDT